ncbi:MAG: MBOAT family protein [Hyphomonadaceae bacterium]
MLSTEPVFFLCGLAIFIAFYAAPSVTLQTLVLAVGSFAMYSVEGWAFLAILIVSSLLTTICSYFASFGQKRRATFALAIGVTANLLVLAAFKYYGLILPHNMTAGSSVVHDLFRLGLPIGISFYTFHGVSLIVDTWRNRDLLSLEGRRRSFPRHLLDTSLYLSFFPQLVAGPITKGREFFPQITRKYLRDVPWTAAAHDIAIGMFLKRVIADNLNELTLPLVDARTYDVMPQANLFAMIIGYSAQIFADFAGYSLIAIGVAKLFGYKLPDNFNQPYIAQSITDFWRRWHMSLSSWLREYLYISLGGNKHGVVRTYFNLLAVMILGGLWHGAAWKFAFWGLWHGLWLVSERALRIGEPSAKAWYLAPFRVLCTFTIVTIGWMFFRLNSVGDFLHLMNEFSEPMRALATRPSGKAELVNIYVLSAVVLLFHVPKSWFSWNETAVRFGRALNPYYVGALAAATLMASGNQHAFIYFQF